MSEIFDQLNVLGSPLEEEDKVIHVLATLPKSFEILVTTLETIENIPKLDFNYEKLQNFVGNKSQFQNSTKNDESEQKALFHKKQYKNNFKCNFCHKFGHTRAYCRLLNKNNLNNRNPKYDKATKRNFQENSENKHTGFMASNVDEKYGYLSKNTWIIDSGSTCHMCNDKNNFDSLQPLEEPVKITLGDGREMIAKFKGPEYINTKIKGELKKCILNEVLYIPDLAQNLFSVPKASKLGNKICFTEDDCRIMNKNNVLVAIAPKLGNLYYLNTYANKQKMNLAIDNEIWHQRFAHLGEQNLKILSNKNLLDGFNFDSSKSLQFCEPCAYGKNHRLKFSSGNKMKNKKPLELVHSDLCGKMNAKSLS